jgi:molybdenum cofactor cytidylyltransferase
MTRVAIVLAAGASRRLGHPKQLVPIGGTPLVRRIAIETRAACDRVAVVIGANAGFIAPVLDDLDVTLVWNGAWRDGMSSSIRAGLRWARQVDADAAILCACDQPRLDRAHLARLQGHGEDRVVASRYAGVLGVPALFPRRTFDLLETLRGDQGARRLLEAVAPIAIDWPDGAIDLDTPAARVAAERRATRRAEG